MLRSNGKENTKISSWQCGLEIFLMIARSLCQDCFYFVLKHSLGTSGSASARPGILREALMRFAASMFKVITMELVVFTVVMLEKQ